MRSTLFVIITLITFSAGAALALRSPNVINQGREQPIKLVISQLPANDNKTPVEIVQPDIVSPTPNQIDNVSYKIRNNTNRSITAVAVSKRITYEEAGKSYVALRYSTMDYAFHPDFSANRKLTPGTDAVMESSGPVNFGEDAAVKEIALSIDYVLFDDNSSLGAGNEGERKIIQMRDGARKYKQWLKQSYSRDNKSLAMILPLMQETHIPTESKLSLDETLGADRYRLQLLQVLQTKGAAEVEACLNK